MSNKFIEILTIECLVGSVKYVVLLVYHFPTASLVINDMFVDALLSLLRITNKTPASHYWWGNKFKLVKSL